MNKLRKSLGTVFIFLFLAGIVVVAYSLFELPDRLIKSVDALNNNNIDQAGSALNWIYLVVGLVMAVGLGIITINLMSNKNTADSTINAHTFAENENEKEDESNEKNELELAEESKAMVKEVTELGKGKGDKLSKYNDILAHICKSIEASQAVVYLKTRKSNKNILELFSSYAYTIAESETLTFEIGEGIIGQVAKEGNPLIIDSVPDGHIEIFSGLGNASPTHLFVVPIKKNNAVIGVAELSSFKHFNSIDQQIITDSIHMLGNISDEKTTQSKPKAGSTVKEKVEKSRTSKTKKTN